MKTGSRPRGLQAHESVRTNKRKTYRNRKEGFAEKVGGRMLRRRTFLNPTRAWPQLEALLQKCRAKRWALTAWIQAAT